MSSNGQNVQRECPVKCPATIYPFLITFGKYESDNKGLYLCNPLKGYGNNSLEAPTRIEEVFLIFRFFPFLKISKFSKSDLVFGGEDNSKIIQQSAARATGKAEEPHIVRISFFFIQNLTMYPLSKCVGGGLRPYNEYLRYTLFFQGQVQRGGRTKFNEDFCDSGRLIKG